MLSKALNRIHNLMNENSSKRKYFLIYTLTFGVTALLVFSWFIFSGKTLIYDGDGWTQHTTALAYYSKFLRSIAKSLIFEHKLIIPEWDFALGEGADIVNTLHFYVIGEPLNLLSVFVPISYIQYFYSLMMVFRLYLAGLTFSLLCFETSRKNPWANLAGAVSYSFSGWALLCVCTHPFFLTPLIYFPLLILGIEKIINNQKPYILITGIVLAAVSNFYFFYMQVMLVIVYFIIRAFILYKKDFKKIITLLFKITLPAVIGLLISGVILLPVLRTFLFDARMSTSHKWSLMFPLSYYSAFPATLISSISPNYMVVNMSAPAILCAALILRKKSDSIFFRVLIIVTFIFCLIPAIGQIFNGLSYISNRWTFSLALMYSYILVYKWDSFISLSKKDARFLFICTAVYFVICLTFSKSIGTNTFSGICFLLISIFAFNLKAKSSEMQYFKETAAILLIIAHVLTNAFWSFSDKGDYAVKDHLGISKAGDELMLNDSIAIKWAADEDFVRYSGRGIERNKNLLNGISSTYFYWSITNSNIVGFRDELSVNDIYVDMFRGYGSRSALLSLSSVNYFITKKDDKLPLPYGFVKTDNINVQHKRTARYLQELKDELGTDSLTKQQEAKIRNASDKYYNVYKNENALPVGYCYDKYNTKAEWETMTALERQEIMLSAVYLEDDNDTISPTSEKQSDIYDIPFSAEGSDSGIVFENNRIVTTGPDKKLILTFKGKNNSETYVNINNLAFTQTPEYDLYFGDESVDPLNLYNETNWELLSGESKRKFRQEKKYFKNSDSADIFFNTSLSDSDIYFTHQTEASRYAFGKTDYLVNVGYSEKALDKIEITFPTQGVYTFDSLDVSCVPMDNFTQKINALKADSLQNVVFDTNRVEGKISASSDKVLCIAIPFSDGWKGYIDGEETPLFTANEQYIGMNVSAGEHTVELRYSRPWKNIGLASTALGTMLLIAYAVISRKKSKSLSEEI